MRKIGLKIGDVCLLVFLALVTLLLFLLPFWRDAATSAEIVIAETGEVRTISLENNADYVVSSREITLTICVDNGQVYVATADCRDGICKRTPAISRAGQSIVCAPAGVVIRITGEEAVVDGVVG